MNSYLQHVALRMEGNLPTMETMILPAKEVPHPPDIKEAEEIQTALEYPKDYSHPVTNTHAHVHVTESDKSEIPSPVMPAVGPSYIQSRLQSFDHESPESKPINRFNAIQKTPDQSVTSPLEFKQLTVSKTEDHLLHHENGTSEVYRKTEEINVLRETEKRILKEIRQPEFTPYAPILPVEPLPPQKIPVANKLTIGKITVEIIRPGQPAVKTKEQVVTRIISSPPKENNSTSKLSYGLKQF